jgi:dolichol-phosphate mannosyltransferase
VNLLRDLLRREVARYGLVGASGVVVDLAVLALLVEVAAVPLLAANVVSFSLAVASNYVLNARWTFRARARRPHLAGGGLFLLAALVGLAISEAGLWLLSSRLGLFYVWAKLLMVAVVFAWNYTFNSAVTFRRVAEPSPASPPRTPPG